MRRLLREGSLENFFSFYVTHQETQKILGYYFSMQFLDDMKMTKKNPGF